MSGIQSSTSQAFFQPAKNIINVCSTGNTIAAIDVVYGSKKILSGALSAGVLSTALAVTGPGVVAISYLKCEDATARTIRMQMIIDGVTAFDATSASLTDNATILLGAGALSGRSGASTYVVQALPIAFNNSLTIKIASSLTETDKIALFVTYWTV